MSRDQRRRLLRQLREASFAVDAGFVSYEVVNGPGARGFYGDWPARERELLEEWTQHRARIMKNAAPNRPWAYFWFDVPHDETIPGPIRDANVAAGRLTVSEAEMMEISHRLHAFARLAHLHQTDVHTSSTEEENR